MTTAAKIGAFFLVVTALLLILIMKIEDLRFGKGKRTGSVQVKFKDVAGLDDKSAVRIAGVRIGKVDGIKLLPDGTAMAKLALDPGVELHEGAYGQIKNLGLLGDKYVEVSPGDLEKPRLPEGAEIKGSVPTGFDDLTKLAADIGKDVKEITAALNGSLGGEKGQAKLDRIVDNIGRLAESLREMVEANRQNVDVTAANLRAFSGEIRETLARIDRILEENRAGVKRDVTNIGDVTEKLKTTADNLNSVTAKIDSGKGTIGKLINDDETVKNLNDTLKAVKGGVDSLGATLGRINKLDLTLGLRTEYLSRSANSRSSFTLDVKPSDTDSKVYRIELTALPNGRRYNTTETTTYILPDGTPATVSKKVERNEDEFGLTLNFGYRFGNTLLRGGLIESRGGVAIDQYFLKDQLQLTGEAYDFTRPDLNGRVKLLGRWNSRGAIFLSAGVDDLLNPGSRSLLIGGGLHWKDDDLKSLLATIPIPK